MNSRPLSALMRALCLLGCASLCLAQACDRFKTARPGGAHATGVDAAADQRAAAASATMPEPPARHLEVEDVGPPAPTVFVLNGLKGYTEPCGCTLDVMAGGIDRIVGYIEARAAMAPKSLVVDGGNIWFEATEVSANRAAQEKLKAELLARSYSALGVRYTLPGPNDLALGLKEYRRLNTIAGLRPLAANLKLGEEALEGAIVEELEGLRLGILFVVDDEVFEGIKGVSATPEEEALAPALAELKRQGAEAIVLMFQGEMARAKELAAGHEGIDFVLASLKPEETDRVDALEHGASAMQVFDQGRYVGVLKLYEGGPQASDASFENARTGSRSELESIERQLEHVNASINKLPPASPGEEPQMLLSLRERLQGLERERERIKRAAVEVVPGQRAFVWQAVRMEEGYPEDQELKRAKAAMNKEIKRVNAARDFELVPVAPGERFYVGNDQCKTCHAEAYAFWEKTNHAHALQTLVEKEKEYDQDCIGCHVVGYEKPGGSVLGKLRYEAPLGEAGYVVNKNLENVGCENCHGPGSEHVEAALFGEKGDSTQFIHNAIESSTCMGSCHVVEHSPRFEFEVYIEQITGPGHERRSR